jgi:hypothetical protein
VKLDVTGTRSTPGASTDPWPFLILGLALLAVGLASWRPVPAGVWNDDGVYLLIGKALARGDGLRYAGIPGGVPAVKFPPLYPLVLASLWSVFRTLGSVTLAAVMLNLLLLATAGTLLAISLRSAGVERNLALALAGIGFLSADVWRIGLVPLSESLFMALMGLGFVCWARASRPGDRRGALLLSVVLTAAILTRSAGLALVVGFGVALVFARGARAAAAVVAPPLGAGIGWGAWAAIRAATIPPGMRDVLGPYGSWLAAQSLGAPVGFLSALPGHALEIVRLAIVFLLPGLSGSTFVVAAIPLGALIALGLVLLHRRFPPMTWVVLSYGGMLLVWPFVDRRLVTPIHPLLVVAIGCAVHALWSASSVRRAKIAVSMVVILWLGVYSTESVWRVHDGWAASPYRLRSGRLATAIEVLRRTAPAAAVVGAPEFWAALHLHGGWSVIPSALFEPRSSGSSVPVWGTPEDQISLWWNAGLGYLLLEQGGMIHGDALDLVEKECPGAVSILARMPPQMLVRLQWDDACARTLGLSIRS